MINNVWGQYIPTMSKEELDVLFEKALAGDLVSRDTWICANLPLVIKMAKTHLRINPYSHLTLDDLVVVGAIALIRTLEKWKTGKNARYSTYLKYRMMHEIKEAEHYGLLYRLPRSTEQKVKRAINKNESVDPDLMYSINKFKPIVKSIPEGFDAVKELEEEPENIDILRNFIGKLPEIEKTIVNKRLEEYSFPEIAEFLKIDLKTVEKKFKTSLISIAREIKRAYKIAGNIELSDPVTGRLIKKSV